MIIFLTDGEATIGETEPDVILRNAQNALGLSSLFGLAFGDDADFPMLRRLSLENRGVARMVSGPLRVCLYKNSWKSPQYFWNTQTQLKG